MAFEVPRGFSLIAAPQVDPAATDFVAGVGTLDQSPAAPYAPFKVPKGFKLASPLVNQTVVPKGGVPRQITQAQGEDYALYDKMKRVQQARAFEEANRSTLGNFALSAQKRIGDAILGIPSVLNQSPPARIGRAIAGAVTGQEIPEGKLSVDEAGAQLRHAAGAVGLDTPIPLQQAQENVAINEGAREAVSPWSTGAGNVAGDIISIVSGRVPIAGTVVGLTKSPQKLEAIREALDLAKPGAQRFARRLWASAPMTSIKRALGKAGEVGLEGATLAYLHDGDPVKTALYGSGSQLAGSFALSAIKHPYYSMGSIAASALGWQMFKDVVPGGRDLILKSAEHATKVAAVGTVLGGIAGALGAGRYRGSSGFFGKGTQGISKVFSHKYAEDLPKYAEGVNAALRTGPNSLWEQFMADEKSKDPVLPAVMDKLSTNVNAFTQAEIRRLSRAATQGKLRQEIAAMLKDENFAARMGY